MRRLSLIASMITERPDARSTMSAAARAASVAPETAMPQFACLSAGASFTPSPVIPTIWPCFCSTSTMLYLSSGNTCAKPSAFSMDAAVSAVFCLSRNTVASRMFAPHAQLTRHFLRDGQLVAGDHFDFHAHLHRARDSRFGLFTRRIGHGQHPNELP